MVSIVDNLSIGSRQAELEQLRALYMEAFPVDEEREDFDVICQRVSSGHSGVEPESFILLDTMEGAVRGGAIYDWYPSCGALELIYIVVDAVARSRGIGRSLFVDAMPMIQEHLGHAVRNVFFESEDPLATDEANCPLSPVDRLGIYDRWGALRVPLDYVQPPLSDGQEAARNLFLFCLPLDGVDTILKADLIDFLRCFYAGLGASASAELVRMERQICRHRGLREKLMRLENIRERPRFQFPDASVCLHYTMVPMGASSMPTDGFDIVFNSYECDLMNFRNQIERPVRTHHVKTIEGVLLELPSFYSYSSEGYSFSRLSSRPGVKVDVSLNYTWSPVTEGFVADVVLAPAKGIIDDPDDDEVFTEYELIKLATHFGSKQENVRFHTASRLGGVTIEEFLARELSGDFSYTEMYNGVSEIELSTAMTADGRPVPGQSVVDNFSSDSPSVVTGDEFELCKSLCGILLGIFDHGRMNAAEVTDTIRAFVLDEGNSFMVFSRGHLCKVKNANEDERNESMYISPYILIPSAVIALNEMTLSRVSELLSGGDTRSALKARHLMEYSYLQDIYNYRSEMDIDAAADVNMGRRARKEQIQARIKALEFAMTSEVLAGIEESLSGMGDLYDIFISYSRRDAEKVRWFVDRLAREGYRVWIDKEGIESGDQFKLTIVRAIERSRMVLFFSSAASNASQWTAKEIGIANARSKPIIPVRLDGSSFSKEVEFDLVNNDFVDFTDEAAKEVAMAKLLKSVAIKCRGDRG